MIVQFQSEWGSHSMDLSQPLDISLPLRREGGVEAFHIPSPRFTPFQAGPFVGDVSQGGSCNCEDITFNPHGNGTHTEGVGHITEDLFTIGRCMKQFFFLSQLVSISPRQMEGGDRVIDEGLLGDALGGKTLPALIIRTLPNGPEKKSARYSGQNPPFFTPSALAMLREKGVDHLLVDLPSVDREDDGGELLSHRAFWNYPHQTRWHSSITELIYVPSDIEDGRYGLELQVLALECDASPSRPLLYRLSA